MKKLLSVIIIFCIVSFFVSASADPIVYKGYNKDGSDYYAVNGEEYTLNLDDFSLRLNRVTYTLYDKMDGPCYAIVEFHTDENNSYYIGASMKVFYIGDKADSESFIDICSEYYNSYCKYNEALWVEPEYRHDAFYLDCTEPTEMSITGEDCKKTLSEKVYVSSDKKTVIGPDTPVFYLFGSRGYLLMINLYEYESTINTDELLSDILTWK